MKKLVTLTLCIALMAALLAGCGEGGEIGKVEVLTNTPATTATDTPTATATTPATTPPAPPIHAQNPGDMSADDLLAAMKSRAATTEVSENGKNLAWPASAFPAGFPAYPDGVIVCAEPLMPEYADNIMVIVENSDESTYKAYLQRLEANGWVYGESEYNCEMMHKDTWLLMLAYMGEEGVFIYAYDTGYILDPTNSWPTGLPFPFPEYTDGKLYRVEWDTEGLSYSLLIQDTSKSAVDAYYAKLVGLGWSTSEYSGDALLYEIDKQTWWLFLESDNSNEELASIYVFLSEYSFGESKTWPEDISYPLPVYTDGTIERVYSDEDSCMITISGTSRDAYLSYSSALAESGWVMSGELDYDGNEGSFTYDYTDDHGDWALMYSIEGDEVRISIIDMGKTSELMYGWPVDLPSQIPVYPEGEDVQYTIRTKKTKKYGISLTGTSQAAVDSYINGLIGMGWVRNEFASNILEKEINGANWNIYWSFIAGSGLLYLSIYPD